MLRFSFLLTEIHRILSRLYFLSESVKSPTFFALFYRQFEGRKIYKATACILTRKR